MSRSYKTTGIVIGRRDLGEADRLVALITPDYGKLRVVVRGARKAKSRLGGHVELFSKTDLVLASGKSLDVVTGARLVSFPHGLLDRPEALSLAYEMAKALDRLIEEHHEAHQIFALTDEALTAAADPKADLVVVELAFKLRLSDALGYRPELSHCMSCHQGSAEAGYRFEPVRGGLVCGECAGVGAKAVSIPQIKLWRLLLTHHISQVGELGGAGEAARETLPLANEFIEHHVNYRFGGGLLSGRSG